MDTMTYNFLDESSTREAAKNLYRAITDGFDGQYTAVVVSTNNLQQRYGVSGLANNEEVLYFMVNSKNSTPYITFNFKSEAHMGIFEAVFARVAEEHGGIRQKQKAKV
jgi:hypothetical protein